MKIKPDVFLSSQTNIIYNKILVTGSDEIFINYVKNFHIKDRKFNSKTVRLGKGDAKLKKILNYMKKIKYKNNFILQTARSKSKEHIKEIQPHSMMLI